MNGLSKLPCFIKIGFCGFAPQQIRIRRVRQAPGNCLLNTRSDPVETFSRAFAGTKRQIIGIDIRGQQIGCVGIGAGQNQRGYPGNIGRQARCDKFLYRFLGRYQHFTAHMAALLHRRQLIFKVYAGRPGTNHAVHEFIGIEHATEASFSVGNNRCEVIDVAFLVGREAF